MPRLILVMLLAALAVANPAHAGQSYDNCSGFIDSVPATITTQGVWCLRADLSTAITSGAAITIAVNNVTVDCNHFKLGGLGGGPASLAVGVASQRVNTAVRNCNIRGFAAGINVSSAGGNLVESNRLDGNLTQAIAVSGSGSLVRDNQVFDTGMSDRVGPVLGILAMDGVDVIANTVSGVASLHQDSNVFGIYTAENGIGSVRDNRIKAVVANSGGDAYGIYNQLSGRIVVRDNDIQGPGDPNSQAIRCQNAQGTAGGNFITGFASPVQGCSDIGNTINLN